MPFTLNLTGTAQVDDSIVKEFDAEFRIALAEQGSTSQFASMRRDFEAESISLPRYDQLDLAVTPLTETEDVESEALSDDKVIVIPEEHGKVVTTTKLANLQTKGMADRAAARLVGINAGRTDNRLALLALDAGSAKIFANGTGDGDVGQTDVMTGTLMSKAYNRLSRQNAIGVANGDYVMIAHEDVIFDIREQAGAASWTDVHKYALPETVLRNEVGMYKGLRVIKDNLCTIRIGAGAGGADVYESHVVGFNALGVGVSMPIEMRATGPYDKLNRFVNMGWYGVMKYQIIEENALVSLVTASSALQ